jgi:hypothetical protein
MSEQSRDGEYVPDKNALSYKKLSFKSVIVLPGIKLLLGADGSDPAGDNKHYR